MRHPLCRSCCPRPCRLAERSEEVSDFNHGNSGLRAYPLQVTDCRGDVSASRDSMLTPYHTQRPRRNIKTVILGEV